MATDVLPTRRVENDAETIEYRPLSTAAVASLVFGLLSSLIFPAGRESLQNALMLAPIGLIGLVLGVRTWVRFNADPTQFTGIRIAKTGTILSALGLVCGLGFASYVYATEVPEGYAPTSFIELKPDEVEMRGNVAIPPDVAALDGQKVFIKGYIRPDSAPYRQNISQFLLVRDNYQCCFGDLSTVKYFDQMLVVMQGDKRVDYSSGIFRMGGILRVYPEHAHDGARGPAYVLEADYSS